jgi:CTP synthase|uniref:CTP synthase n=1 Tax=candidate division WOR-3 bacterium TaxID=2052148 RepID=A0A7V5Y0I4_UNCW3
MAKYVIITGGVVSSLGKGIATASIGLLLKVRGFAVNPLKFDPYINVDPGTMNPYQHGEVFVTEDGAETDLDLGHYERFLDVNLSSDNNVTAGQVYLSVIEKEREGIFLGGTIQVVPHITNEIKERIRKIANDHDVILVEIGGTVGDIESLPFLEAVRQLRLEEGKENVLYIHLTLVPFIKSANEFKTKPTQHSVNELRRIGIQPDIILCRTERPLPKEAKEKIALFCNVTKEAVIEGIDTDNIYKIPLIFREQNLDWLICQFLSLQTKEINQKIWQNWLAFVNKLENPQGEITIGIVGKYTSLRDAYKSVIEAINHAGGYFSLLPKIKWIEATDLEEEVKKKGKGVLEEYFADVSGIIVPGGFGARGIEGKILACEYARKNNLPFLGLCVGLQCAVIEFARNVLLLKDAHSQEFDPHTKNPVIHLLASQREIKRKGGTMRLGAYPCLLKEGTIAYEAYQTKKVYERHRHRYEVNNQYLNLLEKNGMVISGLYEKEDLVEIIELKDHPFFVATQFHPEFKSRPLRPHPLFLKFVEACRQKS